MKALDKETLELIDRLLSGYEIALENILYKNHSITEDVANIDKAREAIDAVLQEHNATLCDNCEANDAEPEHACPYSLELHLGVVNPCNCCAACEQQCKQSI